MLFKMLQHPKNKKTYLIIKELAGAAKKVRKTGEMPIIKLLLTFNF